MSFLRRATAGGGEAMTAATFDADVIISGAGPSGLMVGCETALGGASTIILEKRSGPHLTRAGTLAPRVLEIFASRGIIDTVMARAYELHADPRTPNGIWAGLPGIDYRSLDTDYPYVIMFPQIETEQLLASHFQNLGGEIRLKSEVTGLEQDEDGVTVHYRHDDGNAHSLRARYLVGCDGSRSAVRSAAGIDFIGEPAHRVAINVDALSDNPYPTNLTVSNSEHGWAMTYPLRKGLTRFAMIDAATCRDMSGKQPSLEQAKAMLRRVHGSDFGIQEVNSINTFHDALYMAQQLRKGRVFLVGESVRVHYPASGVGMQFCLQDAFNLGWKLAYATRNDGPDWLLDSFTTERLPEINRLLDNVRTQCAIQFNFDREHVALKNRLETEFLTIKDVNRAICTELAGLSARYPCAQASHDSVGRRFPNLALKTNTHGADSVFSLLRSQKFALLDLTAQSSLPGIDAGLPIVAAATATPASGDFQGIASVLVRPDGHVAWVGDLPFSRYLPQAELEEWLPSAASRPLRASNHA
jgi:2-polyprenyl-6-methoxyphenol hydroxylase-like FAD-dependent oxidoreductase